MNITVTFTDCPPGGSMPEGAALVFRDVDEDWILRSQRGIEDISCADYGCAGCDWIHRRLTGRAHLNLEAHGGQGNLRWETGDGLAMVPGEAA